MMEMAAICSNCGEELRADGLCPFCLFRLALADQATATTRGPFLRFEPTAPPPRTGTDFGAYTLIRLLGMGGFGSVWEAEHRDSRRRVALKIVTELRATSEKALVRFEREGQLAAAINDPHAVFVYGAELIEGYPAIVMELMPHGTLQDQLDRRGRVPATEAVDMILDVVAGLEAAERVGVIHRDIKPSNCFVDGSTVKIGDFGI